MKEEVKIMNKLKYEQGVAQESMKRAANVLEAVFFCIAPAGKMLKSQFANDACDVFAKQLNINMYGVRSGLGLEKAVDLALQILALGDKRSFYVAVFDPEKEMVHLLSDNDTKMLVEKLNDVTVKGTAFDVCMEVLNGEKNS